jgi:hypothetical protein
MINRKLIKSTLITVLTIISTTLVIAILGNSSANAQMIPSDQANNDIILLSQRYNNENDTESLKASIDNIVNLIQKNPEFAYVKPSVLNQMITSKSSITELNL